MVDFSYYAYVEILDGGGNLLVDKREAFSNLHAILDYVSGLDPLEFNGMFDAQKEITELRKELNAVANTKEMADVALVVSAELKRLVDDNPGDLELATNLGTLIGFLDQYEGNPWDSSSRS